MPHEISEPEKWKAIRLAKTAIATLRTELDEAAADNLMLQAEVAALQADLAALRADAPKAAAPIKAALVVTPTEYFPPPWRLSHVKIAQH